MFARRIQLRRRTIPALFTFLVWGFAAQGLATEEIPSDANEPEWALRTRLAERSFLLDAAVFDGKIIVVGDHGLILTSQDSGSTWVQAEVPTRRMLTAVTVVNDQEAWVVGHDAMILHSPDGGRSWASQFQAPEYEAPLFDVWFEDTQHGIAVGAYGLFLETHDGGDHWGRRSVTGEDPHLYSLAESPGGVLYLAGEFGALFKSTDRGHRWEELISPYEGSFFGVLAPRDSLILAFGLRGKLFRSTDDGSSWMQIQTGTDGTMLGGLVTADEAIIIAGLGGNMLISADEGASYKVVTGGKSAGISAVSEVGQERLLLVGEAGAELHRILGNR